MAKQHETNRRSEDECDRCGNNMSEDASCWESELHPSSTAPSTDESSYQEAYAPELNDTRSLGEVSSVDESDSTHDMQALGVVLEFICSMRERPGQEEDYCSAEEFYDYDDRTVDSLVLTRRRFAKNRQDGTRKDQIPCVKMVHRVGVDCNESAPASTTPQELESLLQTRDRLVKFVQDSERLRRVLKKRDSLELTRRRHPDLIHAKDEQEDRAAMASDAAGAEAVSLEDYADRYLKRRVRRLMRTKDSLELARERLPHCIHTRTDNNQDEDFLDDDELSCQAEYDRDCFDDECLDDNSYHDCDSEQEDEEWDSDFDPFEDDLDSILITKERLAKRKKESAHPGESTDLKQSKVNHRRFKDIHYGRMGFSHSLLQTARPNTGGANCAA
jgi:hypothetical protein